MTSGPNSRVLVVLDAELGEGLRAVWPGRPVWLVDSPRNAASATALRSAYPGEGELAGITLFQAIASKSAEELLIAELDMIDLHHGRYANGIGLGELEVVGTHPTQRVRSALEALGLGAVRLTVTGFVARRIVGGEQEIP